MIFPQDVHSRYESALSAFVNKIKNDPNILAIILYGSLAKDSAWEKSDVDTYVLVREMKSKVHSYCIEEDGIIINVNLQSELDFKRSLEKSQGGGMNHSFFSRAKIMYATDDSWHDFLADMQKFGADDRALSFFQEATGLIGQIEKVEKWLAVREDPLYAQLNVLYLANYYANMRLILDGKPISREAIVKVMEYDPATMKMLYERPLSGKMSRMEIKVIIAFCRQFLTDNLDLIKKPITAYMSYGEVHTVTALVRHFNSFSHGIYHIFDFLAEMGIMARTTQPVRITPKSRHTADEVAFVYIENMEGMQ